MFGSIMHRLSGMVLYAGGVLLLLWLWGAAYDADLFACLHAMGTAWYGQLVLAGLSLVFFYHLANGLRHLWWDTGRGLDVPDANRTGWLVLLFAIAMTAYTWWLVYQPFEI